MNDDLQHANVSPDQMRAYAEQEGIPIETSEAEARVLTATEIAALNATTLSSAVSTDYPECSGDPAFCPENEGHGCCKPNPLKAGGDAAEALLKYGRHLPDCLGGLSSSKSQCTCGFYSAFEKACRDEVARPDLIEKLIWHTHECDDLTLDEALDYLAQGWKKVHGRTERQLILQIVRLFASHPSNAATQDELAGYRAAIEKIQRLCDAGVTVEAKAIEEVIWNIPAATVPQVVQAPVASELLQQAYDALRDWNVQEKRYAAQDAIMSYLSAPQPVAASPSTVPQETRAATWPEIVPVAWLKPGAIVPVTPDTVATLLRALQAKGNQS